MPRCACHPVHWKTRRAYRLTNETIEAEVLLGGGHIADFRLCGSSVNALWEAPWPTIEPETFSAPDHAPLYGDGPAGRLLCGYTGHALALGYFGMPSDEEAQRGLPLHGEAASSAWTIVSEESSEHAASLTLTVDAPSSALRFTRELSLHVGASALRIEETVSNLSDEAVEFQWVQPAAFGEPLFARSESSLVLPAKRCMTWPLGYDGHPLLADATEFRWPHAPRHNGQSIDISLAFAEPGTGFVACALLNQDRRQSFVAVHNRSLELVAGYSFDRQRFPWIALWEENQARTTPPWNGRTRVRGVEFGTSPMPLGLEQAKQSRTLFDRPVLASIRPGESIHTRYHLFVAPTPQGWQRIEDVNESRDALIIRERDGREFVLNLS